MVEGDAEDSREKSSGIDLQEVLGVVIGWTNEVHKDAENPVLVC